MAAGPEVGADVIQNDVHAAPAGYLFYAVGYVLVRIVDYVVRAYLPGAFGLLVGAGGGDDGSAHDALGDLYSSRADAGGCGQDERGFPGLERALADEDRPAWQIDGRQGCGFLERERIGDGDGAGGWNADELGVAAAPGGTEHPGVLAEFVLAGGAETALVAGHTGVDDDALADLPAADGGAYFHYLARGVSAENMGGVEVAAAGSSNARAGIDVEAVEGRGADAHLDVVGADFRLGQVAVG